MGYTSYIQSTLNASFEAEEIPTPSAALRELAAREGFDLEQPAFSAKTTANYLKRVSTELKDHYFDYWFQTEAEEDGSNVDFKPVGEQGKAYTLEEMLEQLAVITAECGGRLNGDVVVIGEAAGDIWKVSFKDNVSSKDEVVLSWKNSGEPIDTNLY